MKTKQRLIILSGVLVVIAVFLGFGVISSTVKLFGGTKGNNTINNDYEEEISLGEIANCSSSAYSYKLLRTTSNYVVDGSCDTPSDCETIPSTVSESSKSTISTCDRIQCSVDSETGERSSTWTIKQYSKVETCSRCKSGYYKDGDSCSQCPNTYPNSDVGSTSISACYKTVSAGKYVPFTGATAINCSAGTFLTAHRAYYGITESCTACSGNTYSDEGVGSCADCSKLTGQYYCNNHKKDLCPNDQQPNSTRTGCENADSSCPSPYSVVNGKCVITVGPGKEVRTKNGGITSCPVGSHRIGTVTIEYGQTLMCEGCSIGTYQDEVGKEYCKECNDNTKSYQDQIGQRSCKTCEDGIANQSRTACVKESSSSSGCYCNATSGRCQWSETTVSGWVYNQNIPNPTACNAYSTNLESGCFKDKSGNYKWGAYGSNSEYTYVVADKDHCNAENDQNDTYVLTCPATVITVGESIACAYNTSSDSALAKASSSDSSIARASVSGNYVMVKGVKVGGVSVYGRAANNKTTNSVSISVSESITPDDCNISVSTGSIVTSVDKDNVDNSYYVVNVLLNGKNCSGKSISYSATNAKVSPDSYTVSEHHGTSSVSTSFKVYPKTPCVSSRATAKLDNGKKSTTESVSLRTDWTSSTVCETNPSYKSFEEADRVGASVYYTNYGTCADGVTTGYRTKWVRYGCGGGGSSNTPKCYVKGDDYKWSTTALSGYTVVEGVTKEENCKKEEDPACYLYNNEYKWGKFAKEDGYTLITSIKDENSCKTPTVTYACYKKDSDYVWTTTAPEGYTIVSDVNNPESCKDSESPACYYHNGEFVWDLKKYVTGYILLENIDSEEKCKLPTDACYVDNNGNYSWGDYSDNADYKLVPNAITADECAPTVPTPITDLNVSKLIYVFMTILMAFGIGFIYYASVLKKNN